MRLEPVLVPDALHARMADTHRVGHAARTPVRGVGRAFLDCFLDHPELEVVGDRLAAGRLGPSLDEAADAGFDEVVRLAPDRRLRNADRAHGGHNAVPLRRQQHDPGSFDDLVALVSICRDPLKRGAILRTEPQPWLLSDMPKKNRICRRSGFKCLVTGNTRLAQQRGNRLLGVAAIFAVRVAVGSDEMEEAAVRPGRLVPVIAVAGIG